MLLRFLIKDLGTFVDMIIVELGFVELDVPGKIHVFRLKPYPEDKGYHGYDDDDCDFAP